MLDKSTFRVMDVASIIGGATVPALPGGAECTPTDLTDASQCAFQVEATFSAAAGNAVFHFRTSAVGGTDANVWDTVDFHTFTLLAPSTGGRVQATVEIPASPKFVVVLVENLDPTLTLAHVRVTRVVQQVSPV